MSRTLLAAAVAALAIVSNTRADFLPIFGAPTFDAQALNGYSGSGVPSLYGAVNINKSGVVVGNAYKMINGEYGTTEVSAVRWDGSGAPGVELDGLAINQYGRPNAYTFAINEAGTAVGYSSTTAPDPDDFVSNRRAVRWEAGGTTVTELGHLGLNSATGRTSAYATAINTTGTTVGIAQKFGTSSVGFRPVRWNAGQTVAVELGTLGANSSGVATATPSVINSAGTIVGYGQKYSGTLDQGARAIRWDADTNAATALGHLGTTTDGKTNARATAMNEAGTAIGYAQKYVANVDLGQRATRWDTSTTAAIELGNLGTSSSGVTTSIAHDINPAGVVIGSADKYVDGVKIGARAVRWDAASTSATELGLLPANDPARSSAEAYSISAAGLVVGQTANLNDAGTNTGTRAVLWGLDGVPIDLNTLIDPASGWFFSSAYSISDTNWITGRATFDPDGDGPTPLSARGFLIHVPEPVLLGVLPFINVLLRRRRA